MRIKGKENIRAAVFQFLCRFHQSAMTSPTAAIMLTVIGLISGVTKARCTAQSTSYSLHTISSQKTQSVCATKCSLLRVFVRK